MTQGDDEVKGGPLKRAELPLSFTHLRLVPQELLDSRVELVKELREGQDESYRLVKDNQTGEHYLHYGVRHLNVAAGGTEEQFHQLMPLDHDEVISFALGAEDFIYPQDWHRAYLRNGPHGGFVWYDPAGAADESAQYDAIAAEIRGKLEAFRSEGRKGAEDMQQLMDDMERLFRPGGSGSAAKDPSSE